jgi:cysteinyl-tRNA synthetase
MLWLNDSIQLRPGNNLMQIYNTLIQQKHEFKPLHDNHVDMYVCGITVYDYCHIGHARTVVAFDVIYRYLQHKGYTVRYIRNITDIDDKIIHRANENGEPISDLTERFIQCMHEDFDALGIARPTEEPRATAYMQHMIDLISVLIQKGLAYVASNGDVYYAVKHFKDYGKLSHRKLDDMRAGERVDINDAKKDPMDFVLWKMAKPEEPHWDSPWGKGRPGWHIECSAMAGHCLGDTFDIHGGGFDLQFPHHENEIAQSEGATGKTFVNTWMHVGFVNIDDEKMSKSLKNFFTIREVLDDYSAEVVRMFLISSHYRSAVNYSLDNLAKARGALERLYTALRGCNFNGMLPPPDQFDERFEAAMDDDFNTPEAIAVLFDLAREINRLKDSQPTLADALALKLIHLGGVLGILQNNPEVFLQASSDDEADWVNNLITERNQARAEKNFKRSDEIRDELLGKGIILEDAAGKTTWRRQH